MTERLLQFIWQFQYFNKTELRADTGEAIHIIHPGQYNTNQGPDFTDAKIIIDATTWAGTVELHILSSDWEKHRHQTDKNYNAVILHVVWEHDHPVNSIPVLELKGRVAGVLLRQYEEWMTAAGFIACGKSIKAVPDIVWKSWKERLLAERLLQKSERINTYLQQNNFHWEETCWWLLARNFGMQVNAEAFEAIARSLPVTLLAKQQNQILRLEALLFGQAGLLNFHFKEDYPTLLQKEYQFLQHKLGISPVAIPVFFLRMRPGNFPSIRLAQLAMLIHQSGNLFPLIREIETAQELRQVFAVTANDYWHYHYRFEEPGSYMLKKTGASMIDSLIMNTAAPLLFAYGQYHGEEKYKDRALKWLEQTNPEFNAITKGFELLGITSQSAYDSQALIELKKKYCSARRCLDCAVGNSLLKQQH